MQIIVFQYDRDACVFVACEGDTMPEGTTLTDAQARAAQLWNDLEDGQPKQIFIRQSGIAGKLVFYGDNFKKVYGK